MYIQPQIHKDYGVFLMLHFCPSPFVQGSLCLHSISTSTSVSKARQPTTMPIMAGTERQQLKLFNNTYSQ